jgi:2-amino-4-hydroxy-6-hydroxymethyldihydropteridine diphosphokinase
MGDGEDVRKTEGLAVTPDSPSRARQGREEPTGSHRFREEMVYVAVGANLGDREATLAAVIERIGADPDLRVIAASSVFETAPVGPEGQGAYLNAVLALRGDLAPYPLLQRLQAIEAVLGRDRVRQPVRWGPREVDLDILFFGRRVIDWVDLVVPHPRAHERAFVMTPLAEIAPDFEHPVLGTRVADIAASVADPDDVKAWPRPPGWPVLEKAAEPA